MGLKGKMVRRKFYNWAPGGVDVNISEGFAIFLLLSGGILAFFTFWDLIVNYLDKVGWRNKNDTTLKNIMGLGVLGGVADIGERASDNWKKLEQDVKKLFGG